MDADAETTERAPFLDSSARDENAVVSSTEIVTPVLDVPEAAVPVFLAAEMAGPRLYDALGLEQEASFSLRARVDEPTADTLAIPVSSGEAVAELADSAVSGGRAPEKALGLDISTPLPALDAVEVPVPVLGVSPSAQPVDPACPALEIANNLAAALHAEPGIAESVVNTPPAMAVPVASTNQPDFAVAAEATAGERLDALTLVEDDSPAAVLQAAARKLTRDSARSHDDEGHNEDADESDQAVQPEVSFVVTARRKAFWRKPVVRAILVLLVLVCVVGLTLQIAVQERSRIAAMDFRARPWLLTLCEPWACEIAPYRQIADVVIDSSSFAKARGDSYQLSFTMTNNSPVALALPAVEITLTDAQDQPVLRRVLLPADMVAPAELVANGSWSTSLSVIVTTGGARVTGYRLLAFYP